MSIQFDSQQNLFTPKTNHTMYQMQLGPVGHLLHLYYGAPAEDCFDYLQLDRDCGFSPNPYDHQEGRGWSLDTKAQEYSSEYTGDYRVPSLSLETEAGIRGTDLRYTGHAIQEGTYTLSGMPSAFDREGQTQSLSIRLTDAATQMQVSMVFQFEHIVLDQQPGGEKWDLAPLPPLQLKQVIRRWQWELEGTGWNSLFWENHDLPRIVSRWGDDGRYRTESAKMLAALLFGLQGTPYIYQGQELGMTNVQYPMEDHQDIETFGVYRKRKALGYSEGEIMRSIHAKSRDNARTPMQWSGEENAGFTTGTPWLKVNPNYPSINAQQQIGDPDSVFAFYQRLIRLRKTTPVFREGSFQLLLSNHEDIFAYTRTTQDAQLLVVCNFHGAEIQNPLECAEKPLLCNYPGAQIPNKLRPYEARLYLR